MPLSATAVSPTTASPKTANRSSRPIRPTQNARWCDMSNNDWWNRVCPICGNDYCNDTGDLCVCYNCKNCRNIVFSKKENISQELLIKTLTFFVHHDTKSATYFLGSEKEYVNMLKLNKELLHISPEQVEAWYPRTFAQKIDYILLYFLKQQNHIGDLIFIPYEGIEYVLFMDINQSKNKYDEIIEQKDYILKYLRDEKYIEESRKDDYLVKHNPSQYMDFSSSEDIMLTPKALARVDELQKTLKDTKQVFIAMSFDKRMDDAYHSIQAAIRANGYDPRRMDEYAHNNQIVPEMLYQTRQSKFIIADLTGGNNGAYYEAGYASGIGKEVILTCKQDSFASDSHFDVKQQATVIWEDEDDLKNKLTTWIEATIGKAY